MNNKKLGLSALLPLIILAAFIAVFFIATSAPRETSQWIAFGFVVFAFLMFCATPFLTRRSSASAVFGFALSKVSYVYLIVTFLLNLIFMLAAPENHKFMLAVNIIITAAYLVILVINLLANEQTADNLERQEAEVAYIKDGASRVKLLMDRLPDKAANRAIEAAYDALKASPTRSYPELRSIEADIKDKIDELESKVASGNSEAALAAAKQLAGLVAERSVKLKLLQ